jgi:flagellar FliJ protein
MFRFRLQRVLELREQKEKEEAKVFAEAEHAAASARQEHAELQELHAASMMNFVSAHTTAPTVGHLNHLDFVLRALDIRLDHSAELVAAAEGVAAAARGSLDAAARDRRVLDRLKEKHQDVHRAEEVRKDRVLMDEVALGRFTRARMITNEGATEE